MKEFLCKGTGRLAAGLCCRKPCPGRDSHPESSSNLFLTGYLLHLGLTNVKTLFLDAISQL